MVQPCSNFRGVEGLLMVQTKTWTRRKTTGYDLFEMRWGVRTLSY